MRSKGAGGHLCEKRRGAKRGGPSPISCKVMTHGRWRRYTQGQPLATPSAASVSTRARRTIGAVILGLIGLLFVAHVCAAELDIVGATQSVRKLFVTVNK